jgi:DNA-binding CsgD family transcriptional regulator
MTGNEHGELLLERDGELSMLRVALDGAFAGEGRLVTVEGPAGIGKTRLLRWARSEAQRRGIVTLSVTGDELVEEAPFGAVCDLLGPLRAELGTELRGTARLALPVLDGLASDFADRAATDAAVHGLFWFVATACESRPLAVFVDDLQWIDPASARFIAYLGRRVESLPVTMLLGIRDGEPRSSAMASLVGDGARLTLRPQALSVQATEALVRSSLGSAANREIARACHAAAAGNPFLTVELLHGLPTEALSGDGLAERLSALGGEALAGRIATRLSRLGGGAEPLAEALAVLGAKSPVRHLARLGSIEPGAAIAAADQLRAAGIVEGATELSFVHPLVHEAVRAGVPASRLAWLHRQAAKLLAAEGSPPDRVAAHLLQAEPMGEPWVVASLRAAARRALAQGAPETAVAYLQRAMLEPPEDRLAVGLELGKAEAMVPTESEFNALREALDAADDPTRAAEIALELGLALLSVVRSADGVAVLERALAHRAELDAELVQRLEATLIGGGVAHLPSTPRILARARSLIPSALAGEITDCEMLSALVVGVVDGLNAADTADLARRSLATGELLATKLDAGYATAALALVWAGHAAQAAEALDAGIGEAQRRGWSAMYMQLAAIRCGAALVAGDLSLAEAYGERAHALGAELGVTFGEIFFCPALLERGRLAEARDIISRTLPDDGVIDSWFRLTLLAVRGRARTADGQLRDGLSDLLLADQLASEAGIDLSVLVDWVPSAVAAAAALGQGARAIDLAERELAAAEAFGSPRRTGLALIAHGVAAGGDPGLNILREAVRSLEGGTAVLELARARATLGASLRGLGRAREAREWLAQARDLAHRIGAVTVENWSAAELRAAGGRARRRLLTGYEALTPAELRTARLAADGLTNREVAELLFLTTKTVETQLSQAYAKLRIGGRGELAAALAADLQGAP